MLKKPIKASQIANLTDARYFAAWEVNWLGFCLDTSADHFLQPAELIAIREWVEGPKIVGEFGLMTVPDLLELATLMQLTSIQVGPFYTVEQLAELKNLEIFQEIIVEADSDGQGLLNQMREAAPFVKHFVLNFSKNGLSLDDLENTSKFDLTHLKNMAKEFSVLLDMNLSGSEVEKVLDELGVYGLSLKGGAEEKVGIKSFDELDEILEVLEVQV